MVVHKGKQNLEVCPSAGNCCQTVVDFEESITAPVSPPASDAGTSALRPGQLVEVLGAAEIAKTLDAEGKLDGLPFMPEMVEFCGRQFRVSKRADSTCALGKPRRLTTTVHLEQLRCDGSAHRDCQAGCLLLWKEAWLRPVNGKSALNFDSSANEGDQSKLDRLLYDRVSAFARRIGSAQMCQGTELYQASHPLLLGSSRAQVARLVRDLFSRKIGGPELQNLGRYYRGKLILFAFGTWTRLTGKQSRSGRTPSQRLHLKPGEWVQVRSAREILATLDRKACNRGLQFKAEMFHFCGRKFRVIGSVRRLIEENTGQLREIRNDCVLLDSVYCQGQRSFCTRQNYHYWREIWLKRC